MSDGNQVFQNAKPPTIPGDISVKRSSVADRLSMPVTSVIQSGGPTAAVSVEGSSFAVQTVVLSAIAGATSTFTVNNSYLSAGNNLQAKIVEYSGDSGTPYVYCDALADGSVNVVVTNIHAGDALNGYLVIHFFVVTGGF